MPVFEIIRFNSRMKNPENPLHAWKVPRDQSKSPRYQSIAEQFRSTFLKTINNEMGIQYYLHLMQIFTYYKRLVI